MKLQNNLKSLEQIEIYHPKSDNATILECQNRGFMKDTP